MLIAALERHRWWRHRTQSARSGGTRVSDAGWSCAAPRPWVGAGDGSPADPSTARHHPRRRRGRCRCVGGSPAGVGRGCHRDGLRPRCAVARTRRRSTARGHRRSPPLTTPPTSPAAAARRHASGRHEGADRRSRPDHPELVAARRAGIPVEPWQQVVADAAATPGWTASSPSPARTASRPRPAGSCMSSSAAGRDPGAFVGALLPAALTGGHRRPRRAGGGVTRSSSKPTSTRATSTPYRPVARGRPQRGVGPPGRASPIVPRSWTPSRPGCARPGSATRHVVVNVDDRWCGAGRATRRTRRPAPAGDGRSAYRSALDRPVGAAVVDYAARRLAPRPFVGLPGARGGTIAADLRLAGRAQRRERGVRGRGRRLARRGDGGHRLAGSSSFGGVGRRLEVKGEPGGVLVIDDYGHHPYGDPRDARGRPGTLPGAAGLARPRAADLPPGGRHARRAGRGAGRRPTMSSSPTSGPVGTRTRRITSAATLAAAVGATEGDGRRPRRAASKRRPTTWPRGCGTATSSSSWGAVARTSSRTGSSRLLGAPTAGRMRACPIP